MTTTTTDPNGWVSNPPSVLVKVMNTTRENLNGQMGVVVGYDPSKYYRTSSSIPPSRYYIRRNWCVVCGVVWFIIIIFILYYQGVTNIYLTTITSHHMCAHTHFLLFLYLYTF